MDDCTSEQPTGLASFMGETLFNIVLKTIKWLNEKKKNQKNVPISLSD